MEVDLTLQGRFCQLAGQLGSPVHGPLLEPAGSMHRGTVAKVVSVDLEEAAALDTLSLVVAAIPVCTHTRGHQQGGGKDLGESHRGGVPNCKRGPEADEDNGVQIKARSKYS